MSALAVVATALTGPFPGPSQACPACTVDRALPTPTGAERAELWADRSYAPVGPAGSLTSWRLAILAGGAWFTLDLGQDGTQCGGDAPFQVLFRFDGANLWATPSGDRLVVRTTVGGDEARNHEVEVCGVGPGGVPSCRRSLPSGTARGTLPAWDARFELGADGVITEGDHRFRPTFP